MLAVGFYGFGKKKPNFSSKIPLSIWDKSLL